MPDSNPLLDGSTRACARAGWLTVAMLVLSPNAKRNVASLLLLVLLGAASATAVAAGTPWENELAAGKRAGKAGDYAAAERSFFRAVQIAEAFGPMDERLGETLNLLGLTYTVLRRAQEAEVALRRALDIREATLGASHGDTNATRSNLANAFFFQGRPAQAELLHQETIKLIEGEAGLNSVKLDQPLMSLSTLYLSQGRASDAEPLVRRGLGISEKDQGPNGLRVQEYLHQLASVLQALRRYDEAATAAIRALTINREVLGPNHPQAGISLQILGRIRSAQGSADLAQGAFQEALKIFEASLGPRHQLVGETLRHQATSLRRSGREQEAMQVDNRLRALGF